MTTRYRFGSDTNRALFIQGLEARGVEWRGLGDDVWTEDPAHWITVLAESCQAELIDRDGGYQTTSGLDDAGFREAPRQAQAATEPPDYSTQVTGQMKRWPQRRKTRSQP